MSFQVSCWTACLKFGTIHNTVPVWTLICWVVSDFQAFLGTGQNGSTLPQKIFWWDLRRIEGTSRHQELLNPRGTGHNKRCNIFYQKLSELKKGRQLINKSLEELISKVSSWLYSSINFCYYLWATEHSWVLCFIFNTWESHLCLPTIIKSNAL